MRVLRLLKAKNTTVIRQALLKDSQRILQLMRDLAIFEGYAEQFSVHLEDLEERLFIQQDFCVLVAEVEHDVVGILVYYTLPFTYDLKPWFYIKELFIDAGCRSLGLGKQLMVALAQEARQQGCSKIRWDVLSSNERAKQFYCSLGARHDKNWSLFSLPADQITQLSTGFNDVV